MKKFIALTLAASLFLSCNIFASETSRFVLDRVPQDAGTSFVIKNGGIYLPAAQIFNYLKYHVIEKTENHSVTAEVWHAPGYLSVFAGKFWARMNGQDIELGGAPFYDVDGKLYVSARLIEEQFGVTVHTDVLGKTVYIDNVGVGKIISTAPKITYPGFESTTAAVTQAPVVTTQATTAAPIVPVTQATTVAPVTQATTVAVAENTTEATTVATVENSTEATTAAAAENSTEATTVAVNTNYTVYENTLSTPDFASVVGCLPASTDGDSSTADNTNKYFRIIENGNFAGMEYDYYDVESSSVNTYVEALKAAGFTVTGNRISGFNFTKGNESGTVKISALSGAIVVTVRY